MAGSILEISRANQYLSSFRGFLVLHDATTKQENARIAFDDCLSIVVSGYGISYSHNLLQRLCEENIPLIICSQQFLPIGALQSCSGNFESAKRHLLLF